MCWPWTLASARSCGWPPGGGLTTLKLPYPGTVSGLGADPTRDGCWFLPGQLGQAAGAVLRRAGRDRDPLQRRAAAADRRLEVRER